MDADLAKRLAGRRVVASVSGGKDSAALSLWLTEQGIEHDRVFLDTGWEHPDTYAYLRGELAQAIGPIVEVRSEGMPALVRRKGMFPSGRFQFCTTELKINPFVTWADSLDYDIVNAVGIRGAESRDRATMAEWEQGDGLPFETWRPLLRWSLADVVEIHRRHGLRPNPLYLRGAGRVGCWPCIRANQEDLAPLEPGRVATIAALEAEMAGPTMFAVRPPKEKTRKRLPIADVVAWAKRGVGPVQEENYGCMRWGLCETSEPSQATDTTTPVGKEEQ